MQVFQREGNLQCCMHMNTKIDLETSICTSTADKSALQGPFYILKMNLTLLTELLTSMGLAGTFSIGY